MARSRQRKPEKASPAQDSTYFLLRDAFRGVSDLEEEILDGVVKRAQGEIDKLGYSPKDCAILIDAYVKTSVYAELVDATLDMSIHTLQEVDNMGFLAEDAVKVIEAYERVSSDYTSRGLKDISLRTLSDAKASGYSVDDTVELIDNYSKVSYFEYEGRSDDTGRRIEKVVSSTMKIVCERMISPSDVIKIIALISSTTSSTSKLYF